MISATKSSFLRPKRHILNKDSDIFTRPWRQSHVCLPCSTIQSFHTLSRSASASNNHNNNKKNNLYVSSRTQKRPGVLTLNNHPASLQSCRTYASRKFTRQERINEARFMAQSNLDKLDELYDLFNTNVHKVVDLGSVPGTWLRHTRNRLSQLHGVKPEELYKKCTVIGSDLLFCQPPKGTFFSQGNIYSQNTHDQIESLLKESAYGLSKLNNNGAKQEPLPEVSYIQKELDEIQLEENVAAMTENLNSLTLQENEKSAFLASPASFQAHLVLSDLGTAPLQESGFHNNTLSKPYIRSSQNKMLRQPWDLPQKASIDLAEAALLLCGRVLIKGGTFVVRLSMVDLADPELLLLESRLSSVFHHVSRWSDNGRVSSEKSVQQNLFIICEDKKDHWIDKYKVFGVPRP